MEAEAPAARTTADGVLLPRPGAETNPILPPRLREPAPGAAHLPARCPLLRFHRRAPPRPDHRREQNTSGFPTLRSLEPPHAAARGGSHDGPRRARWGSDGMAGGWLASGDGFTQRSRGHCALSAVHAAALWTWLAQRGCLGLAHPRIAHPRTPSAEAHQPSGRPPRLTDGRPRGRLGNVWAMNSHHQRSHPRTLLRCRGGRGIAWQRGHLMGVPGLRGSLRVLPTVPGAHSESPNQLRAALDLARTLAG